MSAMVSRSTVVSTVCFQAFTCAVYAHIQPAVPLVSVIHVVCVFFRPVVSLHSLNRCRFFPHSDILLHLVTCGVHVTANHPAVPLSLSYMFGWRMRGSVQTHSNTAPLLTSNLYGNTKLCIPRLLQVLD